MNFDMESGLLVVERPVSASWDPGRVGPLIDSLLNDQGDLSAVERFAQFHEGAVEPLQGRYYSSLLPASPPGPGQQLAFEVDLDRCSGCKACVAACHTLNGLDEDEAWREVGLLIGGTATLPVIQHVTSACHHCVDPACLTACPVDAYEKDPITGIVRHLDDQCIGCQYCTLACPYDVPKFHAKKGIVRKCDMCGDRLRAGEAPACVQACPHEAIRITVVDRDEVLALAQAGEFLPAAFDPAYTAPTTLYLSSHPADLRPADPSPLKPEPAHAPLVVMLVLTQLAVGGFLVELAARLAGLGDPSPLHLGMALGLGYVGLGASLWHLGRPFLAYRAILGLRHSWLSREVLTLGVFAKLATGLVAAEVFLPGWLAIHSSLHLGFLAVVVAAGLCGVGSSMMVYHVVRRPFWRARVAGVKFAGTSLVLGLATAMASASAATPAGMMVPILTGALVLSMAAKLSFEARDWRDQDQDESLRQTARLLRGPLRRPMRLRWIMGVVGGVVLPGMAMLGAVSGLTIAVVTAAFLALAVSIGGELAERYLFFRAVVRPRMPGGMP